MPLQCRAMLIVMPKTSLLWEVDGQVWPAHASEAERASDCPFQEHVDEPPSCTASLHLFGTTHGASMR